MKQIKSLQWPQLEAPNVRADTMYIIITDVRWLCASVIRGRHRRVLTRRVCCDSHRRMFPLQMRRVCNNKLLLARL